MSITILLSIITGVVCGYTILPANLLPYMDTFTTIALNILILFVGIDIGMNKHIFKDLKSHSIGILLIPLGVVMGSITGGLITGFIIDMPINLSLPVASGFGWYSLSGILITQLHNAELGAIAFLTNVVREMLAVMLIPILAKYLNHPSAIAPAGAASMDTMLPLISRYTASDIVIISFINGVILSSLVPILVPFFYNI